MIKKIFILLCLLLMLGVPGDNLSSSRPSAQALSERRVLFRIATIEESKATRNRLSLALVEGPPGTDFDIHLAGSQFTMKAHFLTDLVSADTLKLRARLNTRRLYGYSERNLPLFEEDQQRQLLEVSPDEAVVLFPFGNSGGDPQLRVEITPSWIEAKSQTGKSQSLTIQIPEVGPEGVINVYASKTPHRFKVEARLLEDSREVASTTSSVLIEELQTLRLQPSGGGQDLEINLTLSNYASSSASGQIEMNFDVRSLGPEGARSMLLNGSGVTPLNSPLTYDLRNNIAAGKTYRLVFKISATED